MLGRRVEPSAWRAAALALIASALAAAGCGGGDDDSADAVPITIAVAASGGDCTAAIPTQTVADLGASRMRLTVSLHRSDGDSELVCDEAVDLTGGEAVQPLTLDTSATDRMDLLVEAFDDSQPPRLLASGAVLGINRRPRLDPLAVLLARAGASSCTPGPLASPRSFHTATALPDGEVLVIGGVAPSAETGFDVVDSIEVYDPGTGQFRTAQGDLPEGRAFHQAILLDSPSDQSAFDLLLVGGVATPGATAPAIGIGSDADPLPFVPLAGASAAGAVVVRYFPWTDPPQVQQMTSSPALLGRVFHAAARVDDQIVVAGGIRAPGSGLADTADDLEVLALDASHRGPYPLLHPRVGAVAAALGDDQVLLFGGNLLSAGADLAAEAAEVISIADGESADASFEPESVALVTPVAHATLTAVDDGLLLAGGLQVESGSARTVLEVRPALRLALAADTLRLEEVPSAGFTGAAYHAAAPLPDGDVLLIGGMPPGCAIPCTSDVVARYSAAGHEIAAETTLMVSRLGHTATVLESGAILVTGGLAAGPSVLSQAELVVPDTDPAAVDLFGRRAGEVVGPGCH